MDIAIDHRGACDGAVAQQHGGGDRDIVEDAVALAAIAERRDGCPPARFAETLG
jgi:hypothetical protein